MDEMDAIRAKKLVELQAYVQERALRQSTTPMHLTDSTFQTEVGTGGVVLVDLWAAWCGPCLRLAPAIEQIAADYAGRVRVGKLNVDENPVTAAKFGVRSIPTLLLFRDGQLVERIIGAVPRQEIERTLRRWL